MKKRKPLTNQDVRAVLDVMEKGKPDIHDLPMFQRERPDPVKPAAPASAPVGRYKHR